MRILLRKAKIHNFIWNCVTKEKLKFTISYGSVNKGLPLLMTNLCWKMCTDGVSVLPCVH